MMHIQNIINGKIRRQTIYGFFSKMSSKLNRTASQCKSKFQRMEREIYLDYLSIPEQDYLVFCWVRKGMPGESIKNVKSPIRRKGRDFCKSPIVKEKNSIANYPNKNLIIHRNQLIKES